MTQVIECEKCHNYSYVKSSHCEHCSAKLNDAIDQLLEEIEQKDKTISRYIRENVDLRKGLAALTKDQNEFLKNENKRLDNLLKKYANNKG